MHEFLSTNGLDGMEETLVAQLLEEVASYGIFCDEGAARRMIGHLLLVIEKNKVVNLTRITDPTEAVTLHCLDSILPLAVEGVGSRSFSSFLDLGTGAGFPGIPFGIMTGSAGVLIDSVGKKVAAVSEFIDVLGLDNLHAEHVRVEDYAARKPGSCDLVLARAVAQSNVLVEYASPLLARHGLLVVEKGRPDDSELEAARRAAGLCGMSLVRQHGFELPRELGHREILVFEKVDKPRLKLPRRVGVAKHEPLGI